jgi:cytochrome c556
VIGKENSLVDLNMLKKRYPMAVDAEAVKQAARAFAEDAKKEIPVMFQQNIL